MNKNAQKWHSGFSTLSKRLRFVPAARALTLLALVASMLMESPYVMGQNRASNSGPGPAPMQERIELNTVLMQSTFKIQSVQMPGQPTSMGTVFVMGRPLVHPTAAQKNWLRYVLITAAHVLEGMQGEIAILNLRRKNSQGDWERFPMPVQIRANGHPLWTKHPTADVAVMYIGLPDGISIPLVSTDLLADDDLLMKFEIHPGETLQCLGYPFGFEANDGGFPVLRSGRIASYPLTPTARTKTFLFDFAVFEGNSGGPVYMVESNRTYGGGMRIGETIQFIAGLVTQETTHDERLIGQYSAELRRVPLNLATVVHASFIKEAVNLLPSPDDAAPH